ncbi:MAG TPA: histidine kinase dimerization/phospho-acceptor domain-containing protein, partial [Pseudonocardiaceae bacterium]|nr:histidine kinase dimerization/phospho-acceptor domain-containing protein [Pseudonocardiaceae bacterium]
MSPERPSGPMRWLRPLRRLNRVLRPLRRLVRSRLRVRALLAVLAVTLVVLVVFDFAAVTALRSYLMNQTDSSLRNAAAEVVPELDGLPAGAQTPTLAPGGHDLIMNKPLSDVVNEMGTWVATHQFIEGLYSVLFIPKNGIPLAVEDGPRPLPDYLYTGPNVPMRLSGLNANGQPQDNVAYYGDPLRSVAVRTRNGTLVISTSLDGVISTVHRMWLIMLFGSAAALLLIGLAAFWLLRRGLRPIEKMATQAEKITAGDLTDRVAPQDPHSEIGRLGGALNGMLARIETSVHEREAGQELMGRFFADASHELRTPLASLRANAELYQQGALPERAQVDEVMRRIGLETRRMSGLVEDMLRLARLDQHPDQSREPVELSELIAGCLDRVLVAAPDHRWHAEISPDVVTVGDDELLRRAVDNLLANVLTHTPADTEATVALRERGDEVEIEVSDTGPGVPPDRLPRIFDRFYRA